jgi:hypothetical protein
MDELLVDELSKADLSVRVSGCSSSFFFFFFFFYFGTISTVSGAESSVIAGAILATAITATNTFTCIGLATCGTSNTTTATGQKAVGSGNQFAVHRRCIPYECIMCRR